MVVTASPSVAIEGRSSDRMSSLIRAIIVQVGQAPIHCTIVDLTEIGAKLSTKDAFLIAGEVQIEIPLREVIKFARVVWRRAEMVGIEFFKERGLDAAVPAKGASIDQTAALLQEILDRLARIEQHLGVI